MHTVSKPVSYTIVIIELSTVLEAYKDVKITKCKQLPDFRTYIQLWQLAYTIPAFCMEPSDIFEGDFKPG